MMSSSPTSPRNEKIRFHGRDSCFIISCLQNFININGKKHNAPISALLHHNRIFSACKFFLSLPIARQS